MKPQVRVSLLAMFLDLFQWFVQYSSVGEDLLCVVTGPRQYSADLPQGGLEVPCYYTFITIHDAEGEKAR